MVGVPIRNGRLSDIRASFGTPLDQIGWVSTGYMMANIVVIPLTGWLQRRLGVPKYFTVSIAPFSISSALWGLARTLPAPGLFRILPGLGGGPIIPSAQT